jgi:CRP-like cAMP-binding protein
MSYLDLQLFVFSSLVELKEGDYLYKNGDSGSMFWFVLTGKLEVLVKSDDEFKFSKSIDEQTFFGKK